MIKKIVLTAVLVSIAGVASAGDEGRRVQTDDCKMHRCGPEDTVKAPEMDPASAMSGLSLLLGSLVVLRGRRSSSKSV